MAALGGIKKNDIIQADVRGQRFFALVYSDGAFDDKFHKQRVLALKPLGNKRLLTNTVTATQVIGHYRRSAATKPIF